MRLFWESKKIWLAAGMLTVLFVLASAAQTARKASGGQQHKPFFITRLYTGPDGQTHAEEIEAKFVASGNGADIAKLVATSGAQLQRSPAGRVADWHPAPRRQYIVTLSGEGELEVAGGKKIHVGPGHIELVEDTTGKGHITRTLGTEDRITIQIPLADQSKP